MPRGFTLVELLVAMGVFMIGIMGVFGLFLGGVRARDQAESLTRLSFGATSLIEELRLDAVADRPASDWLGDGYTANGREPIDQLSPYPDVPGMFYVVDAAENAVNPQGNGIPTVLRLSITAMYLPLAPAAPGARLEVAQELRWRPPAQTADPARWLLDEAVARGVAIRTHAVVIPRQPWLDR